MPTELSVLVATRNRAQTLEISLNDLLAQRLAAGDDGAPPDWEVIVVDNASADQTGDVLRHWASNRIVRVFYEPQPGKAHALNRALDAARGEIIVITDDNVRPSPGWLAELLRAKRQYPEAAVFCGPIIPEFPHTTPDWLREHPSFSDIAFARFNPPLGEGELPRPWWPFGKNVAVRSSVIGAERFRTDLGPGPGGDLLCEDIELLARLRKPDQKFIYLPAARVIHVIDTNLLDPFQLCERAFRLGQSVIRLENLFMPYSPDWVILSDDAWIRGFETSLLLSFYYGQLSELSLRNQTSQCRVLFSIIHGLDWPEAANLSANSAVEWAVRNPQYLPQHQAMLRAWFESNEPRRGRSPQSGDLPNTL